MFENENAISCLVELSVMNQNKSTESHTSRSVEPLAEPWSTACLLICKRVPSDKNMLAHSQNRVVRISKISVKKSLQVVT